MAVLLPARGGRNDYSPRGSAPCWQDRQPALQAGTVRRRPATAAGGRAAVVHPGRPRYLPKPERRGIAATGLQDGHRFGQDGGHGHAHRLGVLQPRPQPGQPAIPQRRPRVLPQPDRQGTASGAAARRFRELLCRLRPGDGGATPAEAAARRRVAFGQGEVFPEYFSNTASRKRTIRIDSKLLAEAKSTDPGKARSQAAEELRRVVATVGKKGQPGEHVRCVVSVSMLTEDWDAQARRA